MKQQKILIVTKHDISSWKSCQHITQNLLQSYKLAFPEAEFQSYPVKEDFSYYESFRCAKDIKAMKVDFIIWLDHKPCAANMVTALNEVYSDTPFELKPKFLVHLFGDFVLDCKFWEHAEKAINHYPVHFLVASDRQKKLVDKFFLSEKKLVSVVAFPVEENLFSSVDLVQNRNDIRDKFKLTNELVFIYTGRISFQKNVDVVVSMLDKIKNLIDEKIELWVVGSFDDILLPFFGMAGTPGSYYSQFNSMISTKETSFVRFLGSMEADELVKIYHASDVFISFSTFNDEDYGMSVAEAMMTGLPCVLSDWGGFASFANYGKEVELVQVDYQEPRMSINTQQAQKKIFKIIDQIKKDDYSREILGREAAVYLSVESIGKKLAANIGELDFKNETAFSMLFYKLCGLFLSNPYAPFKNNNVIYKDIYGEYATCKL